MKIASIKVGKRDREKLVIRTEDGTYISARIDDAYNLRVGDEITVEEAEELEAKYSKTLAKKSAAKTLAYRSASKGELTKKLLQKGFSEEDSKEAVLWLEERGFVDDESYADALVEYYTARGYGERRINEELRRRGISREICEDVSSRLPDFTEEIKSLIEKKLRGDVLTLDKKNKIVAFLIRRGFGYSEIKTAFSEMQFSVEDFD